MQQKLFGLMAHPVNHSLSPLMHNAAFQSQQLPFHYHAFDVSPDQLSQAIVAMRTLGIQGMNVSIPHKECVLELIDELDEEAKLIGAVNTIIREKNGILKGYNTDGEGYVRSLLQETDAQLREPIILIGAGGAAKGIAVYLIKHGCESLTIVNRTEAKASKLIQQLKSYAQTQRKHVKIESQSWHDVERELHSYSLIINTTPIGMWPRTEQTPMKLTAKCKHMIVSDIVYNPLHTAFLQEAKRLGAQTHLGIGMFLYQGAIAYEKFTGQQAPIEVMRQVVMSSLQQGGT